MGDPEAQEKHDPRVLALKGGLLVVWVVVSFVFAYFARDLQFMVAGWPWDYWFAAQGAVLAFIAIVVVYASWMKRLAPLDSEPTDAGDPDV
jgi:putative solute:sodium symporter small subunit